jgi:hypothetical protein
MDYEDFLKENPSLARLTGEAPPPKPETASEVSEDWLEVDEGELGAAPSPEPILRLLNLQLQRQRCSRLERFSK